MIPSPLMKGESWHTAPALSQSVVFQKVGGSRHNLNLVRKVSSEKLS